VGSAVAEGDLYSALSAREDGWTAGVHMVGSRPILGVGGGAYGCEFFEARLAWLETRDETGRRGEVSTHFEWAHNEPLQIVSELGVLGWLWVVAVAAAVGARVRELDNPLWAHLFIVCLLPFLLLHYPMRLAVSLGPCAVMLATLLASSRSLEVAVRGRRRLVLAIGAAALAVLVVMGQVRALRLDLWRARAESILQNAAAGSSRVRAALVARLGNEVDRWDTATPEWVYRVQGRGELLIGEAEAAEASFRRAMTRCVHSESELGLGLALAAQGDRNRALIHLANACTVNPQLLQFVEETALRNAVEATMQSSRSGTTRRAPGRE
jgi:hypothetical protein